MTTTDTRRKQNGRQETEDWAPLEVSQDEGASQAGVAPHHPNDAAAGAARESPNGSAHAEETNHDGKPGQQTSKAFLRSVKHEEQVRRRQQLEEAKRLEGRVKAIYAQQRQERRMEAQHREHGAWVERVATDLGINPERPITDVPAVPPGFDQLSLESVREGRAYLRLLHNTTTNKHLYEVIEPQLTASEKEIHAFLRDTLVRTLDARHAVATADAEQALEAAVRQAIVDHSVIVDAVSAERIHYLMAREFLGYGPIDVLMLDPMLEDISCDGPGIPLYVFHRKHGSIQTNVVFEAEPLLDSFVIRLAQRSGKHISIAEPLLDATLPDGSRLQTTLGREVTTRGSSFTIRKFRMDPMTPPDLIEAGTMDSRLAAFLWLVVEKGASVIIAGGTASGKTTTLNAACQFIPSERKIVSIEDTREINLNHENWIAGVTRSGFGEAMVSGKPAGTVDMYKLLEAALRQRPEYLLVGEVRGPEALTLFQAMATGHTVYSTMHADSVQSAVYRLENPPISVPRLMLETLDLMLIQGQVREQGQPARRILEVTEFTGFEPTTKEILTNAVFRYNPATGKHAYLGHSHLIDGYCQRENMSQEAFQKEWDERAAVLDWMCRHNVRDYLAVSRIIAEYYLYPDRVRARVQGDEAPTGDPDLEAAADGA